MIAWSLITSNLKTKFTFSIHFLVDELIWIVRFHSLASCKLVHHGYPPFSANFLHFVCISEKHWFPELWVLASELIRQSNAKSMIKDNNLEILTIFWMWPDKNIARMRITMYKPSYKYLISKSSNKLIHNLFLIISESFQLFLISYLNPIDPFRNHHPFSCEFINNPRHMKLLSF